MAFAAFVVLVTASIVARLFLRRWIIREHEAGRMTGRRAGWLFGATIAAPFVLLGIFVAMEDIGQLWFFLLLGALVLPVQVIPWVAIFRYPSDEPGSKRFGGPVR